jgi:hypothetical protein
MKVKFPACSQVAGKQVEQGLTIMDMTHGSMLPSQQVYGLVKLAAQVGSDYYPEIMGNLFVCNAGFLFTGVWSVVKNFLDEKTRKKIQILGGSFQKTLLEYVEKENLPDFLGGTSTVPIKANVGPWQEFEHTAPKGIRKKGTGP